MLSDGSILLNLFKFVHSPCDAQRTFKNEKELWTTHCLTVSVANMVKIVMKLTWIFLNICAIVLSGYWISALENTSFSFAKQDENSLHLIGFSDFSSNLLVKSVFIRMSSQRLNIWTFNNLKILHTIWCCCRWFSNCYCCISLHFILQTTIDCVLMYCVWVNLCDIVIRFDLIQLYFLFVVRFLLYVAVWFTQFKANIRDQDENKAGKLNMIWLV